MSKGLSTALRRKTGASWRVVLPFMAAAMIASYALFSMFTSAGATHVDPVFVAGNPVCSQFGYDNEDKIDSTPTEDTYQIGPGEVEITYVSSDNKTFDWESDFDIDAVIVKGGNAGDGPGANVYHYDPAVQSDSGLEYGTAISHVTFCWNDPEPGKIIVEKETDPATELEFEFDPSWDSNFELGDGDSEDSGDLDAGEYTVAEVNLTGRWELDDITCTSDGNSTFDENITNGVTIDLAEGDVVTCVFRNLEAPLEPLEIEKDAAGTFDRTYTWTLNKSVSPDEWYLFDGDTATSEYTVTANSESSDGNWAVTGTITITNPNDEAVTVTDISDSIDGVDATITTAACETDFDVPANSFVECEYEASEADGLDGTEDSNTVTVTAEDDLGGTDTANFTYQLDQEINDELDVEDVVDGDVRGTHTFSVGDGPWVYDATFDCSTVEYDQDGVAQYTVNNTVREVGNTDNSASADVTINCYELQISKDAEASYDRTITWDIDKSVDVGTHNLQVGESGTSNFTVAVTKTETDGNYLVEGTITIVNPNPERDAQLTALVDQIDGANVDTLDCDGTETVPAGDSIDCDYSDEPDSATDGTNVATATMQNYDFDSNGDGVESGTTDYDAQAAVTFGDPNIVGFETVNVDDIDEFGVERGSWTFSESDSETYPVDFDCTVEDLNGGSSVSYTVDNTAEILETDQEDSASVTVNCSEQEALEVSKDVELEFDRTYEWGIDKSVTPESHILDVGGSADSTYTVAVTKSDPIDSGWTANGTITIYNPATVSAEITGVSDVITQTGDVDTNASIDSCEIGGSDAGVPSGASPVTLGSEETMTCEYSADLPSGDNGTNQATVSTSGAVPGAGTSEDVNFDNATINETLNEIDVTDTYDGAGPWNFNSSDSVQYDRTFTCTEEDLGGEASVTFDVDNTATITQTGASDDATVEITCNDVPPEQGQIIVIKDATPDDSPWTFHFSGAVDGEILHGQQLASGPLDPGTYTVSEDLDELIGDTSGEIAWDLVDIVCVSADENSTSTTDLAAGSAEIDLGEGDTVTCTFFNEAQPPVVIPEVPAAILFPIIMLGLGGGAYLIHRRRTSVGQMA